MVLISIFWTGIGSSRRATTMSFTDVAKDVMRNFDDRKHTKGSQNRILYEYCRMNNHERRAARAGL